MKNERYAKIFLPLESPDHIDKVIRSPHTFTDGDRMSSKRKKNLT